MHNDLNPNVCASAIDRLYSVNNPPNAVQQYYRCQPAYRTELGLDWNRRINHGSNTTLEVEDLFN